MRASYRIGCMCLVPVLSIVGISLVAHGATYLPSNLTLEEAWAAGTAQKQLELLQQKRYNSTEYKEILVGAGLVGTSVVLCLVFVLLYNLCPSILVHDRNPPPPSSTSSSPPNTLPELVVRE
jgi:hypothetical protein